MLNGSISELTDSFTSKGIKVGNTKVSLVEMINSNNNEDESGTNDAYDEK
jgi:hypothetical protein